MAPNKADHDVIRLRPVAVPGAFHDMPPPEVAELGSLWSRALYWMQRRLLLFEPGGDARQVIRNVVVIGIHGWAVLGGRLFSWSPSDVSLRMAQSLAAAVRQRLKRVQDGVDLDVTVVPLFGHGLVDARLDEVLVEQLPAHKQAFQDADAVFIAAHSQGAVLAGLLMETLIEHGWVSFQRHGVVGLLFMAGPHHGPFPDLPNDRFPATAELFALGRPYAQVAERALRAVAGLLQRGVRIAAVGADRDAVVPMFSSVLHALGHHRRLLRAVYVQQQSRADVFPVRLLRLCLAWANTHSEPSDLLPHLSGLYRGALFDLEGPHSTIHTEPAVYDLAAHWLLLDGDTVDADCVFLEHTSAHWAVHLNDAFYYSDLNAYFIRSRLTWLLDRTEPDPAFEVDQLRASFEEWSPRKKSMRHLRSVIGPLFVPPAEQNAGSRAILPVARFLGKPFLSVQFAFAARRLVFWRQHVYGKYSCSLLKVDVLSI